MSVSLWCLFLMAVFTVFNKAPFFLQQAKMKGGYDNANPRAQRQALDDRGKRALAAHQNGFEIFAFFAAGVLVAHVTGPIPEPLWVRFLSVVFVLSRVAYTLFYINGRHTLRSIVWGLSYFCCLGLMLAPLL